MLKAIGSVLAAPGRIINAVLELKNEATGTRKVIIAAVLMITVALAGLSICGAFATTAGGGWLWIPRVIYALLVLGLETLAAVLFMRAMLAGDKPRMIVCLIALPFLVLANVQNAKDGVHAIKPDLFAETSQTLTAKAELAASEAATLSEAQQEAISGTGSELERVRTQIATLEIEQRKMAAQSPEGIKEAQALLLAQGKYFGSVDGIRADLTEAAMRRRGEELHEEIGVLKQREQGLLAGQASPVQQATTDKRIEEIEIRAKAQAAADAATRLDIILWISEFARNFMLWAAATAIMASELARSRQREDEIAEAEHKARLAAINAGATQTATEPETAPAAIPDSPEPIPEPVVAQTEPEPEQELVLDTPAPVEPEPTAEDLRNRAGGQATQHLRKAAKVENLFVVGDWRARDAVRLEAARVAAE